MQVFLCRTKANCTFKMLRCGIK